MKHLLNIVYRASNLIFSMPVNRLEIFEQIY